MDSTTKALEELMKGRKDDSNIVKDGDDLILKHGTPHDFTKFQLEKNRYR